MEYCILPQANSVVLVSSSAGSVGFRLRRDDKVVTSSLKPSLVTIQPGAEYPLHTIRQRLQNGFTSPTESNSMVNASVDNFQFPS